jgi:hypothetical protein
MLRYKHWALGAKDPYKLQLPLEKFTQIFNWAIIG